MVEQKDASRYLQKLGRRLQKQKITGEILVLSGITMFLDIKKPRMHADINAYLAGDETAQVLPKDIASYFGGDGAALCAAATEIAEQEHLPSDWLRRALQTLFFSDEAIAHQWIEYPGLRAYLATPEYWLAMRVATASKPQDIEEGKIVARSLHIESFDVMLQTIQKYIPEQLCTLEMITAMKAILA
jgi:hypothetical protein